MALSEFDLIRKYFDRVLKETNDTRQGIGDDAAIISVPDGMELALSMDTLVQDVHFHASTRPEDLGYKSLAVNLSDLAAMGAEPRWATLSLTIPGADQSWVEKFSRGFFDLADQIPVALIGGDLNKGPLSVTVQVHGLLPAGQAILRKGAKPGDLVYVSGYPGEAGLGLRLLNKMINIPEAHHDRVLERLHRPEPRITLGLKLREIANSAIDISDGLIADLSHMLDAGQCGAMINLDALPLSAAFDDIDKIEDTWEIVLTSGDDYELCFTVNEDQGEILDNEPGFDLPVTCIGKIISEQEIKLIKPDNTEFKLSGSGFRHF